MFWILKKSRLNSAVSFFNSINNNGISNTGYNKLCGNDSGEAEQSVADSNGNDVAKKDIFEVNFEENDAESDASSCSDVEEDLSRDSDYDENLTCNVCDRFFCTRGQLSDHQQKKRHFGCSSCDSLFPSLMALEHHKEEFEHWSGSEAEIISDDSDEEQTCHEMERLL